MKKTAVIALYDKAGYAEEDFSDPACTQPLGKSDGVSDLHLYTK